MIYDPISTVPRWLGIILTLPFLIMELAQVKFMIIKKSFIAILYDPFSGEEICPACDLTGQVNTQVSTLDLAFYPEERGVYNFESSTGPTVPFSRGVNPDGRLLDPETRWGGLMRGIDNTNFEAANVEYIEFWL